MASIKAIEWAKKCMKSKLKNEKDWEHEAKRYRSYYEMECIKCDTLSSAVSQAFIRGIISSDAFDAIHDMHLKMWNAVQENVTKCKSHKEES